MALETHMIHKQPLNGKTNTDLIDYKLYLKELELNSLLEITKAINSNLPESSLYKIYHFTILGNLHVKKLALFVFDSEWECKVNYGTKDPYQNKPLNKKILKVNTTTFLEKEITEYREFNVIIPIAHKDNMLAYVFLGGIDNMEDYKDNSVISFIQTITSIIIVAIENKKLARKELQQEAFKKEMQIAREVQSMLVPKVLPCNDSIKMFASYLPHLSIGGDYYDYIPIDPDKFLVCVGDVSGKGIPAALLMSNFQASLRTMVRQTTNLKEIINELNYGILRNSNGERFITFFIALCNTKEKTITYINAGHNPSFVVFKDGTIQMLEKGSTVLGAFSNLPFIDSECIDISQGALLFAYTDGLTETCNEKGEEFGLSRLRKALSAKSYTSDLPKFHESLIKKLDKFKGKEDYMDDITYVSCLIP